MGCVTEGISAKESSLQRGEIYSSRPWHTHTSETEGRRVIKAANTLNPVINHKGREGRKGYWSTIEFWFTLHFKRRIATEATSSNTNGVQRLTILDGQSRILNTIISHNKTELANINRFEVLQALNAHSLNEQEAPLLNAKGLKILESSQIQLLHIHTIASSTRNSQILDREGIGNCEWKRLLVVAPRRFWFDECGKGIGILGFQFC